MALADLMSIETKLKMKIFQPYSKLKQKMELEMSIVSQLSISKPLSLSLLKRIPKTENPFLTPLFWSMPKLSQLTFSMMIQINAFTSAQAGKLATDSKTSYEGLEASRISKITLPNFTNPVDTSHGNVTTAVEAEANVPMTKSEHDLIVLPSTNVSKVLTNEIFANTKMIQYLIPMLRSNLKKSTWISIPKTAQDQVEELISKITCHRDLIGNDRQ